MAQAAPKRRISVGVLFWIAFILLVLVIFLANRSNIEDVLNTTGLVDVVRDRFRSDDTDTPEEQTAPPADAVDTQGDPAEVVFDDPDGESGTSLDQPSETVLPPAIQTLVETPVSTIKDVMETAAEPIIQRAPSPDPAKPNRLMADLYFIRVTGEERIRPQVVTRPVYYDSSPLTETINALIAGPRGDELEEGLLNLIPSGTTLLSAHVQNGVAYLNFNQAFRFNQMGAEGTLAQLQQIIYSSTEFPTVDRVQILIEGETLEYLNGEGIYVGEPLDRDSFG
jgi:germination protein M